MNTIITFLAGDIWATFEALITSFTLILVGINYFKNQKKNETISIYICQNGQQEEIHNSIIRQHITRGEIKGVLNDCSNGTQSYDIAYLSSKEFFKQMQELHKNKTDKIVIQVTNEDTYTYRPNNTPKESTALT